MSGVRERVSHNSHNTAGSRPLWSTWAAAQRVASTSTIAVAPAFLARGGRFAAVGTAEWSGVSKGDRLGGNDNEWSGDVGFHAAGCVEAGSRVAETSCLRYTHRSILPPRLSLPSRFATPGRYNFAMNGLDSVPTKRSIRAILSMKFRAS